jgi:hypothetical protein
MNGLTAVDVLLDPEPSMLALAQRYNTRMLTVVPDPPGFALDEHHRPHVTTLQRYVRTADLGDAIEAVEAVVRSSDVRSLRFTAHGVAHMPMERSLGLAAILVAPGPEVVALQSRLISALEPYTDGRGDADAFVRTAAEPDIDDATLAYVERYVPDSSGENYTPHVTIGLDTLEDLAAIEAEDFDELVFTPQSVSIYQLGNNGTAARLLKTWAA